MLRRIEAVFAAAGLTEPRADAGVLVEAATGLDRAALVTGGDAALGEAAACRLERFVARRLAREPVFRIVGWRPFWGFELQITPDVLDPRPDTETVVEAALAALRDRRDAPLRVLDLGTGSGAILCAVLAECTTAFGFGVDRSAAACAVARANLVACGLGSRSAVFAGDWDAALAGRFDLVLSNPPYVASDAIAGLDPEVRDHDPRLALDGGADGLDPYRLLSPALPRLLRPGGVVVVEVGSTQADAVTTLFAAAGLTAMTIRRDVGGHARAVIGRWPGPE